jgi:hypothetical protein
MKEPTPTLRFQLFSMLTQYRLCDVLQGIDDIMERAELSRNDEQKALLRAVQAGLGDAIDEAEKIEFDIAT